MMPAETEPEMYVAIARTVVHDEAEQRGGFKDENRQRFTRLCSFAEDMASLFDICGFVQSRNECVSNRSEMKLDFDLEMSDKFHALMSLVCGEKDN